MNIRAYGSVLTGVIDGIEEETEELATLLPASIAVAVAATVDVTAVVAEDADAALLEAKEAAMLEASASALIDEVGAAEVQVTVVEVMDELRGATT